MEHNLTIRVGDARDAAVLARFNVALAEETEGERLDPRVVTAGVSGLLSNPAAGFYVVAEQEHVVCGALMLTFEWSDWRNKYFWWIQSVYVTPSHRRRGIFSQLMREVVSMAADRSDVCGLRLYVREDNQIAQATYKRLGMEETHYDLYEVQF